MYVIYMYIYVKFQKTETNYFKMENKKHCNNVQ